MAGIFKVTLRHRALAGAFLSSASKEMAQARIENHAKMTLFSFVCLLVLCLPAGTYSADKPKHADVNISGYGLAGNIQLKRTLKALDLRWKERRTFDANFVEDAALIIMSQLNRDGYLNPALTVELTLEDGTRRTNTWKGRIEPPLPRPLTVQRADLKIEKGVLYRFEDVAIQGQKEVKEKEVRGYFVERGVLLPLKKTRVYTPQKLERGMENLEEVLMRRGYENADVTATNLLRDDATGKVNVTIDVNEGKKSMVRSIRQETFVSTNTLPVETLTIQTNVPFSKLWEQDYSQALKATNYARGYPDTTVEIKPLKRESTNDILEVDLLATIRTGERITLRDAKFEGLKRTKSSVVERQVHLEENGLLNRIEAERGRQRLAKLGIFDSVNMRYDIVDDHTRDVIYTLTEGKRLNFNLLFGYGSYELARVGFEVEQFNVLGRAHHSRLRAVQSVKATTADYRYTMPQFLGEQVDMFINAFYLHREEKSFTREEFGGGAGARTFLDAIASDFSARYNYEVLSALDTTVQEGPTNATVGAIILELKHDQRDSPLYPRRGYKVSTTLEMASEVFAGDVNYLRFESLASYHQPIGEGQWVHFGISHGAVVTMDGPQSDLPFNKRFFPGGENSIRGFQYGEAAPLDAAGRVLGAETYTVGNFEFEQALTDKISFVTFVDAIGFAKRVGDYPLDEYLLSVGGGFRWKTIVGPIRLEYGHNIISREHDPSGTIHFSIGFPF